MPGRPDALVDLRTGAGATRWGRWRYAEARMVEVPFVDVGSDLGPTGAPNRTLMFEPAAAVDHDDSAWTVLAPEALERRLGTGMATVLADRFRGRRLNSPNDLVFSSDGTLYFTDPPFGLPGGGDDPAKELPFSGVFGLSEGELFLVTDEMAGPNGVALSPDEQTLYVGDWDPVHKAVVAYPLDPAGRPIGPASLVCDLTAELGEDAIDGIKVAADGTLFVCGPGGVYVVAASGTILGRLVLPEAPHNLAWGPGTPDLRSSALYITALTSIYRLSLA